MNEMDSQLDARLRAAFAPPPDAQRMARDVLARSGVVRPAPHQGHWRAVAAILFVALGLGWLGSRGPAAPVPMDAGELHASIAAELGDQVSCTSPEESIPLATRVVGTPLDYRGGTRVPLQGPFARPLNWTGDPAATVLAGHFEGRVVVVVIESVGLTQGSSFELNGELRAHRRELGGYVLHEISDSEVPVCLDEFTSEGVR